MNDKPTLADVNGTVPGKAALVSLDLDDPNTPMFQDFEDGSLGLRRVAERFDARDLVPLLRAVLGSAETPGD